MAPVGRLLDAVPIFATKVPTSPQPHGVGLERPPVLQKPQRGTRAPQAPLVSVGLLKWFILGFLVVQNTACVLLMRLSTLSPPDEGAWDPQTGVLVQEVMKGFASLLMLSYEGSVRSAFDDPAEALKSAVPGVLYLVQNNLLYIAAARLDAPTVSVLSQLKLLTTAVFSVILLSKAPTKAQWLALLTLTVGISLVTLSQLDGGSDDGPRIPGGADSGLAAFIGVVASVLISFTSGFASVYFEKTLKGSPLSMWARNLQMSAFSTIIGVAGLLAGGHWEQVRQKGLLHGYTTTVWVTIVNNVVGGLLVAMAIKHSDSVMKNFSTSLAIVFTAALSAAIFGTPIAPLFAVGAGLVICAMLLYGGAIRLPSKAQEVEPSREMQFTA